MTTKQSERPSAGTAGSFSRKNGPDGMRARHPDVHEEKVARWRLNTLGLLTCRTCRIEFKR
jgi:hypothetical protein